MNEFKTISKFSEVIYKEKGSKFIGIAFPVDSEIVFKNKLVELKKKYHDASHHCFAFRIFPDGKLYRFSDDGEPSNTAGKPIFGQIESFKLTNIGIVVIRYFGGTKLGVGGLIKAYREAAKETLLNADIVQKEIMTEININFSYTEINQIMKLIKSYNLNIIKQHVDLKCNLIVECPLDIQAELLIRIKSISNVYYDIHE